MKPIYIIYTPFFRDDSGGIIVLHKLCAMLRDKGFTAKIWPLPKPSFKEIFILCRLKKLLKWSFEICPQNLCGKENTYSPYNLSIARHKDLTNSIVVYPEIVDGNPLGAKNVVRWLLNKPGDRTGRINFGRDELFFFFNEHFNDWKLNPNKCNQLRVVEFMGKVYHQKNYDERSATCYMVRKGKNRMHDQHGDEAIKVDGMSHEEMAEVFNRCKYFVSYDLYTMFSRYAAMCGCIPIVVPEEGLSKEQWRPEIKTRYGVAYGWEDIPWALETREYLRKDLEESQAAAEKSVENFIKISMAYFTAQDQTEKSKESDLGVDS